MTHSGITMLEARDITKVYRSGAGDVMPLKGVNVDLMAGELTLLMGPSGSGKTTLLSILGCILSPTSGALRLAGIPTKGLSAEGMADLRRKHVGFVFQAYNLIPVLSAFRNVELPLLLTPLGKAERRQHVEAALRVVGLQERMHHFPRQLSGGQEQRVAIARAIAADPDLLLCDEPTGNLDSQNADSVLELFERLSQDSLTLAVITHDEHVASRAHRRVRIIDGVLREVDPGEHRHGPADP